MKFGVSVSALIRLSLTKYLFAPRLEERLKTSEQYFFFPSKSLSYGANLASCLTCVNFEILLQSVWAQAICSLCQRFSNSLLQQKRKKKKKRRSNVYISSDGRVQALSVSFITWQHCSLSLLQCLLHTFSLFSLHQGLFAASWSSASQSHFVPLCGTVQKQLFSFYTGE